MNGVFLRSGYEEIVTSDITLSIALEKIWPLHDPLIQFLKEDMGQNLAGYT